MRNFIVLYIILELINLSFTFIPVWDLENSSINLGQSGKITLYTKDSYPKIDLYKTFDIKEGKFSETNYMVIDDSSEFTNEVEWEDIESTYHLNEKYYICPKGKAFMQQYDGDSYMKISPSSFKDDNNISDEDSWELICYHISQKNMMFEGFLNQEKINHMYGLASFPSKIDDWKKANIENPFYDFIWSYQHSDKEDQYEMISLIQRDSNIFLAGVHMTIDWQSNIYYNKGDEITLDSQKDFASAYFNHETNHFYWVSSSSSNNFSSGYSTSDVSVYTDLSQFNNLVKNSTSPLQFLFNCTIQKLNMIRNTKFAYYHVTSKEDNNEHYGIIDIEKNQVIFNTNETLIEFKPISNTSMLAVTENSAYQVCFVKENNACVRECSNNNMHLDAVNGNICGTSYSCEGKILKPYDICIPSCNKSIYAENGNECGFCKILFPGEKEFKVFGDEDCYKERQDGTYFISEEFKILGKCNITNCKYCSDKDTCETCVDGFYIDQGECVEKSDEHECYKTCSKCIEFGNEENQKCTECMDQSDFLQEGNCVKDCSEGYYKEGKNCPKCNDNCKTCKKGEQTNEDSTINENCDSCKDNYYLINATNYSNNCVKNCPEGLTPNGIYCSGNSSEIVPNDPEPTKKKGDYMIWIFIILIGIIILIISLCICKRSCSRNKRDDGEIINDINTELRENNNIIE